LIKIKTYNNLPLDTSYTFELANSSATGVALAENNDSYAFDNFYDYM